MTPTHQVIKTQIASTASKFCSKSHEVGNGKIQKVLMIDLLLNMNIVKEHERRICGLTLTSAIDLLIYQGVVAFHPDHRCMIAI